MKQGTWRMASWDPRSFATDVHRTVDDRPFGGGPGMVLMAVAAAQCVEAARTAQREAGCDRTHVIALSASGTPLRDARVRCLAAQAAARVGLVLVCGRYEGIDQRFVDSFVDEEISIGDFILSGGEIAAMALIDAVVRHLPGTMKQESAEDESFADGRSMFPITLGRSRGVARRFQRCCFRGTMHASRAGAKSNRWPGRGVCARICCRMNCRVTNPILWGGKQDPRDGTQCVSGIGNIAAPRWYLESERERDLAVGK